MNKRDYHCSITAKVTVKEAIKDINRVSEWWGNDVEGSTEKLNSIFTVRFGDTFATFKVTEVVPDKIMVWHVIDCYLHWIIKDKKEWSNTKLVWKISTKNNVTKIDFAHIGLAPGLECYETCVKGWDFYVKESLYLLLKEGKGLPETTKVER